jgi:actin cytoskeleton-regulatory complex protein PAN1
VTEGRQQLPDPITEQTSSPTMIAQDERPSRKSSPTTPVRRTAPRPPGSPSTPSQTVVPDDVDDEDSSDEYLSFSSESEADDDAKTYVSPSTIQETRSAETEARKLEQQRVMEAAGLVVKKHEGPTPPPRPRARRRPAPLTPDRATKPQPSNKRGMETVETPLSPSDSILKVEDAYDRYEAYKTNKSLSQGHRHRYSIISTSSVDSTTTPSSPKSASMSLAPTMTSVATASSTLHEPEPKHASGFLHSLFGRSSGGNMNEKRSLTVSGPIISSPLPSITPVDAITRESSPAFGTSWSSLVDKEVLDGIPPTERKRQEVRSHNDSKKT